MACTAAGTTYTAVHTCESQRSTAPPWIVNCTVLCSILYECSSAVPVCLSHTRDGQVRRTATGHCQVDDIGQAGGARGGGEQGQGGSRRKGRTARRLGTPRSSRASQDRSLC
eukprot:5218437-Prymnesium_polylepis.1